MLSSKIKDLKLRRNSYNSEINKSISRFMFINILNNRNISLSIKKKAVYYLTKSLNKGESKTKIVRRCSITTRSRVSHRKLGISRIRLREMLKAGVLPGYSKAIW